MSIFTKDNKVSEAMLKAIEDVSKQNVTEDVDMVHVPGYGVVTHDRAKKEAQSSSDIAKSHADSGNHSQAAYQYERAAMFHKALHAHVPQNTVKEQVSIIESRKIPPATIEKHQYSWGKMVRIHHGNHFTIPLHPEHQEIIKNLKPGESTKIKDETGKHWNVNHDTHGMVHFHSTVSDSMKSTVSHKQLTEENVQEGQQPKELSRVVGKYKRNVARDMKRRDQQKNDKKNKEEKYQ
jgi:hypothetical protein